MSYGHFDEAHNQSIDYTSKTLASEALSERSAEDEDLPQDIGLLLAADSHAMVRADDPLGNYMQRLKHIEPLDADTQHQLAVNYYEDEDEYAARMLIVTNLRLVVKIAREYRRQKTDFFELIQEGNVGLSEAIQRFDPYRGVKFISYAQYWIRAMILNYLMNQVYTVKFGNTRAGRKLFYNLKKARRELNRQGIDRPSPAQIAEHLDVPREEVVRVAAQMDAPPVAIDGPAPGYEGNVTNGDLMPSDAPEPEEQVQEHQLVSNLSAAFHDFGESLEDDRDFSIWSERMIAEESLTLKELGEKWDVSKERIRQVEAQLRTRFKHYLIERFGEGIALEVREMVN